MLPAGPGGPARFRGHWRGRLASLEPGTAPSGTDRFAAINLRLGIAVQICSQGVADATTPAYIGVGDDSSDLRGGLCRFDRIAPGHVGAVWTLLGLANRNKSSGHLSDGPLGGEADRHPVKPSR
jgi:hypothetical protein